MQRFGNFIPQVDHLKEELGWLKLYFAAFFAVDVSLIAWLAQNFSTAKTVLTSAALTAILAVSAVLASTYRRVYNRLNRLEKL